MTKNIYVIDLFAGFGGVTSGASKVPGVKVIACVNHDPLAIKSHAANHPDCIHYIEDIKVLDLTELIALVKKIRTEDPDGIIILWASLECTNHSIAKGGMSRDADSRTLADHLIESEDLHGVMQDRYIPLLDPDIVFIENVKEFKMWGPLEIKISTKREGEEVPAYCPLDIKKDKETNKTSFNPTWVPIKELKGRDFETWKERVKSYGYTYDDRLLDAADFGAFTSRKRYFAQFAKPYITISWPKQTHVDRKIIERGKVNTEGLKPWKAVREVLDLKIHGNSIFGRKRKNGTTKNLSDKTYERIYHGLVKFVAGGKKNFLVNYHHSSQSESLDSPIGSLTTKDKKAIADVNFLVKYNSVNGKTGKYIPPSMEDPSPTVATQGRLGVAKVQFVDKAFSGNPVDKSVSVDRPGPTVKCKDNSSIITTEFISTYHGNGDNCHSVEGPSPTIPTHDSASIIQAEPFVWEQYGNQTNKSVNVPSGPIMPNPKQNLIVPEPFIMDTQYGNNCQSIEDPSPTQTANRKHFYLMNPQYMNSGGSIDKPCFTIIARTDKYPPYLVMTEEGQCAIMVEDDDTPHMIKIKEFMAMYGIVDIKMRMFSVKELLKIQGFDPKYKMFGTQTDHKRFIGNAVEVTQAEVLFRACIEANQYDDKAIAV